MGERAIRRMRAYVDAWAKTHQADVASSGSRTIPAPRSRKAPDLAVVFFENFSKDNPGKFPSAGDQQRPGRQDRDRDRAGQGGLATSSRSSSTCGGRITPTRICRMFPATW